MKTTKLNSVAISTLWNAKEDVALSNPRGVFYALHFELRFMMICGVRIHGYLLRVYYER